MPKPSSHSRPSMRPRLIHLSPRERDVLILCMRGLTNKMIAHELGIAHWTVKQYSKMLYHKIGVHNRAGAVMWGAQYVTLRKAATLRR